MAWLTHDEEGDDAMLFFDHAEALSYSWEDDPPVPLYASPPAVELDAARYRWLRDKANRTQGRNWHRLGKGEIQVIRWAERGEGDILHGETLDAAVDAVCGMDARVRGVLVRSCRQFLRLQAARSVAGGSARI